MLKTTVWVWVTCGENLVIGMGETVEEAGADAMAALLALQSSEGAE